eukprot:Seg299.3 transcript_id=Seg299.3/GoldUCD/mRNA.D3Y31 product="hypothetical protein" protein_id=Seg299.3/GoldUCD/D3Y31
MAADKMADAEEEALRITDADVSSILNGGMLPLNWNPETSKVTYGILSDCFSSLEKLCVSQSNIVTICAMLCNLPEKDIFDIIKNKPSNLKRSVSSFLAKDPDNFKVVFDKFTNNDRDGLEPIGPSLSSHNISLSFLQDIVNNKGGYCLPPNFCTFLPNNENLLDLIHAKDHLNVTWNDFRDWVKVLTGDDDVLSPKGLRKCVLYMKEKANDLKRHQLQTELEEFLKKSQNLISKSCGSQTDGAEINSLDSALDDVRKKAKNIEDLLGKVNEYEGILENLIAEIKTIKEEWNKETARSSTLKNKLDLVKEQLRARDRELLKALEKVSHFNVRNVNKRMRRMEEKIADADDTISNQDKIILELTNELVEEQESNEEYKYQLNEITEKLDKSLKNVLCEQKMKWYYKKKSQNNENNVTDAINYSKIQELNDRIHDLENEKLVIEEKLNIFLSGDDVCLYKDGKYVDDIRMLYEDLLCMGVSTRNVEDVIRKVLKHTVDIDVAEHGVDSIPLAPFFGNRFNILFFNAAWTYYLKDHLEVFFERVGGDNKLLSAVRDDLQETTLMAACRALGLIDKLITGPLWRCIEKAGHIIEMNELYQSLSDCFLSWASDATEFMKGNVQVFDGKVDVHKDDIFDYLILPRGGEFDGLTKQCLEVIFSGFTVVTKRLLGDHLKGGVLWDKSSDKNFMEETKSVKKSNVLAERDFGMLDHLMKLKPKATDFAIEGLLMFKANKTADWRANLSEEKRAKMMEVARKSKKIQREKYINIKEKVLKERAKKNADKLEEKQRKQRELHTLKESLHSKVEKVGLWKTESEVREKLEETQGVNNKREMLWLQIRFRLKVLGASHEDRKVFQQSSGGKPYSVEQMTTNLVEIIKSGGRNGTVTEKSFVREKEKLLEKGSAGKGKEVSNKRKKRTEPKSCKKRKIDKECAKSVPIVSCAKDLVGKRICQRFANEEGQESWYYGVVLSGEPGGNPFFEVRYDDEDEKVYKYRLMEDFDNEDIQLVPITEDDLIGATIMHMYTDSSTGEDCWYRAMVEDVDEDSDDIDNPDFFVRYFDFDEGEIEGEYYLCQLLEDYLNGWVQIVN